MPRQDKFSASFETDLLALGSTVYRIVTGHRPFLELDTIRDEAEFLRRYREGCFPPLDAVLGGDVSGNCWRGEYASADKVVEDLSLLEARL